MNNCGIFLFKHHDYKEEVVDDNCWIGGADAIGGIWSRKQMKIKATCKKCGNIKIYYKDVI